MRRLLRPSPGPSRKSVPKPHPLRGKRQTSRFSLYRSFRERTGKNPGLCIKRPRFPDRVRNRRNRRSRSLLPTPPDSKMISILQLSFMNIRMRIMKRKGPVARAWHGYARLFGRARRFSAAGPCNISKSAMGKAGRSRRTNASIFPPLFPKLLPPPICGTGSSPCQDPGPRTGRNHSSSAKRDPGAIRSDIVPRCVCRTVYIPHRFPSGSWNPSARIGCRMNPGSDCGCA